MEQETEELYSCLYPINESYTSYETRLASFSEWPYRSVQACALAGAGFLCAWI